MEEILRELEKRISQLEETIAALKNLPIDITNEAITLVAPLRVVDSNGNVLLEFKKSQHSTTMSFFNSKNRVALSFGIDGTKSGFIAIHDRNGVLVGYLDVEQAGARLILQNHEQKGGIVLFGGDSGHDVGGGINILSTTHEEVIELWATKNGGEIQIPNARQGAITINNSDQAGYIEISKEDGEIIFSTRKE